MPLTDDDISKIREIMREMFSPQDIATAVLEAPLGDYLANPETFRISVGTGTGPSDTTFVGDPGAFSVDPNAGWQGSPRMLTHEELRLMQLAIPIMVTLPEGLKNLVEVKAVYNAETKRHDTFWLVKGPSVGFPAFDDRMHKKLDEELARAFIKVFELKQPCVPNRSTRSIILEEDDASGV
jgi:hypothetical protein